jgi:hypothetical protein
MFQAVEMLLESRTCRLRPNHVTHKYNGEGADVGQTLGSVPAPISLSDSSIHTANLLSRACDAAAPKSSNATRCIRTATDAGSHTACLEPAPMLLSAERVAIRLNQDATPRLSFIARKSISSTARSHTLDLPAEPVTHSGTTIELVANPMRSESTHGLLMLPPAASLVDPLGVVDPLGNGLEIVTTSTSVAPETVGATLVTRTARPALSKRHAFGGIIMSNNPLAAAI